MSASGGERAHEKFTQKERTGGERVKDGERGAERGLKSRNALTLETSVCILHRSFCHSTSFSTHTPIYQHTHTHSHAHCLLWRMIPGGHARRRENTFQGAINPPPLTPSSPPTVLPKSALPSSLWPPEPTCTSHNTPELRVTGVTLTES